MRDTSKIHIGIRVSQMYPERYVSEMQDTCGIHAGYIHDTCKIIKDTCGINVSGVVRGYMRDTCEIRWPGSRTGERSFSR